MKVSGFYVIVKVYFSFVNLYLYIIFRIHFRKRKGHIETLKAHLFFCGAVTTTNQIGQELH